MSIFENKNILITGGTGSFGKNFAKYILQNHNPAKLIIFSRDELKQQRMKNELKDSRLRFFLGDVRELLRLQRAFHGVDIIVHAAALKQVPMLEYNPYEAVKTNILGSQNVIEAAIDNGVDKVLLVSTDKAVQPVNLYGATKLCAEKLFINGNAYSTGKTKLGVVRYGTVLGSRGSIVVLLLKNREVTFVDLTHEEMTRFRIISWFCRSRAKFSTSNQGFQNILRWARLSPEDLCIPATATPAGSHPATCRPSSET